ncbi:MAG: winged helix-turn-helix transcriptional regulator [archaeon]
MEENYLTKMNLKDRKILYELDSNSRQPLAQISRKVGLSKEVVNYRIKRLENEKIITHYQLIVDLGKTGHLQFKICLKLSPIPSEKLNKIIASLKKEDEVKWIVSCNGAWDFIVSFETENLVGINKLKDKTLTLFSDCILDYSLSVLLEAHAYPRNYLIEGKKEKEEKIILEGYQETKLEEIDLNILKALSENSRTPILEIAKKVRSTPRIVNYRIKQLENKKIIHGYKIAINYEKLGIKFYKTFIHLKKPSEHNLNLLAVFLKEHPKTIHNGRSLTQWHFEPEFEVYSEKEFEEIISELKNKFSDIIKKIDIITLSKEYKFVYF